MRKFLIAANLLLVGLLAFAALTPTSTSATALRGDAAHTEINFSVTHFFTPATGTFRDFEVTLNYDADYPENSTVEAKIAVASVDTGNERRGPAFHPDGPQLNSFPRLPVARRWKRSRRAQVHR